MNKIFLGKPIHWLMIIITTAIFITTMGGVRSPKNRTIF